MSQSFRSDTEIHTTDAPMQDTIGSSQVTVYEDVLSTWYPCLAPPPAEWKSDLLELASMADRSYLTDPQLDHTKEVCSRLPKLLNSAVQVLSRVSGAYISARAVYYNYQDPSCPRVYSTVTEAISEYVDNDHRCIDSLLFADNVFDHVASSFEREVLNTFPHVYTTPSWRGRPVLCPKHPHRKQQRSHLEQYFMYLRVWQGLPPLSWIEMATLIAQGNPVPFAMQRVPLNLPWSLQLEDWDDISVNALYDWILCHQRRLFAGDHEAENTAFQFLESVPEEPLRQEAASTSIVYDERAASYFMAMQHYQFTNDAYIPLSVPSTHCFTTEFICAWGNSLTPAVVELLTLIDLHELHSPPTRSPKDSDPPMLRLMPTQSVDVSRFLLDFQAPLATYTWNHPEYTRYNILSLWQFIGVRQELLLDGRVAGGRTGAYQAALAIMVYLRLKNELINGRVPGNGDVIIWGPTEDAQLERIVTTLSMQITNSLKSNVSPEVHPGVSTDRWAPTHVELTVEGCDTPAVYDWPKAPFGVGRLLGVSELGSVPGAYHSPQVAKPSKEPLSGGVPSDPKDIVSKNSEQAAQLAKSLAGTRPVHRGASPVQTHISIDAANMASTDIQFDSDMRGISPVREVKAADQNSGSDDDPWVDYPKSVKKQGATGTVGANSDKIRPSSLPPSQVPDNPKRARSVDEKVVSGAFRLPASNTLGLKGAETISQGAAVYPVRSTRSALGSPIKTSTPRRPVGSPQRNQALINLTERSTSRTRSTGNSDFSRGRSRSKGPKELSRSRVSSTTSSARAAASRSSSAGRPEAVHEGDETISGSLLARNMVIMRPENPDSIHTSSPREPAVASTSSQRMTTRQAVQLGKRALSRSTDRSGGGKRSKSDELE